MTKKTNRSYKKARIFLRRKNFKKNRFQNIIEQGQQKIKRMWKTIQKVMCEEDKQTNKNMKNQSNNALKKIKKND